MRISVWERASELNPLQDVYSLYLFQQQSGANSACRQPEISKILRHLLFLSGSLQMSKSAPSRIESFSIQP